MKNRQVPAWGALVVLALTLAISYWRLFVGEAFFWGLPALQFVPWRAVGFRRAASGAVAAVEPV